MTPKGVRVPAGSSAKGGHAQAGSSPSKACQRRSPCHPLPSQQSRKEGDQGRTGHRDAMEHLSDQHLPRCALYPGRDLGEGNAISCFRGTRCSALGSCMGRRPSHTPITQTQPSCSALSASVPQLTCLLPHCPLTETKPSLQITPCPRPHPAPPQKLCLQGLSHPEPDHTSWRG